MLYLIKKIEADHRLNVSILIVHLGYYCYQLERRSLLSAERATEEEVGAFFFFFTIVNTALFIG